MSLDDILPSGFPSLDRTIGGGFRAGELVVLGGDAGSGTSSLALALALHASAAGSLFITGEMSSDQAAERAIAITGRVDLADIRANTLAGDAQERASAAARRLRYQSPIVGTLVHDGIGAVTAAVAEHPDSRLVVVDGLESLLTSAESREEQLAFAVLTLKRLAVASRVTVVLVTHLPHLDRTRHDLRPRLADFGAMGALAVHADFIFGLYREELYVPDPALAGATELLLLKWRNGPRQYIDLYFVAPSLRFEDVHDADTFDTSALSAAALAAAEDGDGIVEEAGLLETET